jgi:hypothetical protein
MNKLSGQVAIESLISLPACLLLIYAIGLLSSRILFQHLLWIDAMTLHRARTYQSSAQLNIECKPHSLWPRFYRRDLLLRCPPGLSAIKSRYPAFRTEIQIQGSY